MIFNHNSDTILMMQKRSKIKKSIKINKIKRIKFSSKVLFSIGLIFLFLLGSIFFILNRFQHDKKTYYNNDFLIKFDVPSNWTVNRREDERGLEGYELISEDNLVKISSIFDHSIGYHGNFPEIDTQLGEYKDVIYSKYFNDSNEVIYRADLYNQPRQKDIFVYVTVKGDFEKNHKRALEVLKSFSFTAQEPLIDDMISYSIPQGWTNEKKNPYDQSDPSEAIALYSSDAKFINSPYLTGGAEIDVYAGRLIEDFNPYPLSISRNGVENYHKAIKIAGFDGGNIFECYEGCSETYAVASEKYFLNISFRCKDQCNSKENADRSVYAKDRDYFLNSIKFK